MLSDLDDFFFLCLSEVLENENAAFLHLFLYYMDRAIEDCYMQVVGFEDDVVICDALNSNFNDTCIIILRNAECKWSMRQIGGGLNGFLKNFYYIDKNSLDGMQIKNYILDYRTVLNGGKAILKIAVSPITQKKSVEFSAPYDWINTKTGSFHFKTLGEAFFKQSCNLIWCNTCAASHETQNERNFEIVGLITTLSKQCNLMDLKSFERLFEGKTKCGRENCRNCIYYAEIPLTKTV